MAFGAVPWRAVLAGMSDETLNTLEPFAMNSQPSKFSKEWAKLLCLIFNNEISWLAVRLRNYTDAFALVISARPATFAAHPCGKRDCFAAGAPILKRCFPVVSDRAARPWSKRAKGNNSPTETCQTAPWRQAKRPPATDLFPRSPIAVI